MAFRDIIGQDRAIQILKGCIEKDRIPHALFFTGDEGIGKRLTAVNFAKALNCIGGRDDGLNEADSLLFAEAAEQTPDPQPDTQYDACDQCPSCSKIDKEGHPDFFILGPEGDSGQIKVGAIRQLEESLSYKPFEGRWKIAIIDNADMLNQSAANAFLQTLEEPSAQSMLILISSRPDMVLPTIRSRCQRINFSPLPVDTMSSLLQEKFGHSDDRQARLLSVLSGGRLGNALNEDLMDQRNRSFEIFRQMLGRAEDVAWDDKEIMEEWFEWSHLLLRDIAVYKATGRADLVINFDRVAEIKAFSENTDTGDILNLARELYNIKRDS